MLCPFSLSPLIPTNQHLARFDTVRWIRETPGIMLNVEDLTIVLGDQRSLDSVSLTLGRNEQLAITGPSGCGKSSLLRAIAGLIPSRGRLTWNGQTPAALGWPAWRSQVMYVPQLPPEWEGTPGGLVQRTTRFEAQRRRGSHSSKTQATDILQEWGLPGAIWEHPFSTLSVGERQRVHLAIALALEPSVLLLDEPTSALDEGSKLKVEQILKTQTCIWVSHDVEQLRRLTFRTIGLTK